MTYHTHHLTPLARLSLRMPGNWAWALVLRLRLATSRCKAAAHCTQGEPRAPWTDATPSEVRAIVAAHRTQEGR